MQRLPAEERDGPGGCFLGIAIGVLTIVLFNGGLWFATGASEKWGVYLFQIILVAAPFVLLALLGVRAKLPWFVGLILTAMFWGFVFFDIISSRGDGTGANIGLGPLMLASPLAIAGGAVFAARAMRSI